MPLSLRPASSPSDWEDARTLFREYADSLGVDLGFQGFEAELASLPAPYDEPRGTLILAFWDDRLAGCVGIKPLEAGVCEMKRLYVRPEYRGHRIGRGLGEAVLQAGESRGYDRMRLDTLARLESAVALYRALGFAEIPAYYDNPLPERVIYMERPLTPQERR